MRVKRQLLKKNIVKPTRRNPQPDSQVSSVSKTIDDQKVITFQRLKKIESKLVLSIYFNSLKCLLGRIPILVYIYLKGFNNLNVLIINKQFLGDFYPYAAMAVYVSYSVNFFIFYHGNNHFRKILNAYISKLINKWKIH